MKTYDFIFSLGYACAVSQALRDLGLQRGSYPFDWVGTASPLMGARMIAGGFRDWFNREDLRLWDVRFEGGFVARVYKNVRTGFGFSHEFSNADPIETAYEAVKEKYDRRITRFMKTLRSAKRILAVYLEDPRKPRTPDADLRAARDLIAAACPEAEVELLCLYEDETCKAAELVAASDGISVVKASYRTYLDGTLMHIADRSQIVAFLREHVTVRDRMSEAEIRALDAEKRRKLREGLGRTRWERWVNKKLKQWYRDLEVYLIGQKLIPGDRPLWFDGDGK